MTAVVERGRRDIERTARFFNRIAGSVKFAEDGTVMFEAIDIALDDIPKDEIEALGRLVAYTYMIQNAVANWDEISEELEDEDD